MSEPKNYQAIMLSSTFTDLEEHRARAIEAIQKLGYMPSVMEFSGARADADVIQASLNMVRDAAAYVGVIGFKYGQTPHDPDHNPDGLSITELEFNEAMRLGRPIVLFIMDKDHPVKMTDVETDLVKKGKLDDFRERAKLVKGTGEVQRVYEVFGTLDRFASASAVAVGNLIWHLEQSSLAPKLVPEPSAQATISNIPIAVPQHFLGRVDDLASIDVALKRGRGLAAVTAAVHGLRGVGKTTLAAVYAAHHKKEYRATWWIRAETDATMRADLVGLGVQLGWVKDDLPEQAAVRNVLDRLVLEGQDILLVYDNAVSPTQLARFMPRGAGPRVIVTSNAPNWGRVASPVELAVWPNDVGADFLVVRTGRATESEAGYALSKTLGGLPLAHEQAAAYCERTGISLSEYLKRFEAAPAALLDTVEDASEEYYDGRTVARTFALAIDEAAKLHPLAAKLMAYAAVLAPEPIPLFIFTGKEGRFHEEIADLDEAVGVLRAFALVDRESVPDERNPSIATDCIRLHRLVRQVAFARLSEETKNEAYESLTIALAENYPANVLDNPTTWPFLRRLDAIVFAWVQLGHPMKSESAMGYLMNQLGLYRSKVLAAHAESLELFNGALQIVEKIRGPDHPNTATCLVNLATAYESQHDFVLAGTLYDRALAIREKTFGPNSREVASSLNNMATMLERQGELARAQELHERCLVIREEADGPDDPMTALTLSNLGHLFTSQRRFAEARPYLERALEICQKRLGPLHPQTAASLNNLGGLLWEQKDPIGALDYVERALRILEEILGVEHPDTQNLAQGATLILEALNRHDEAAIMAEKFGINSRPQ